MMRKCRIESLERRTLLAVTPVSITFIGVEDIQVHDADSFVVIDQPDHGTLDPIPDNALQYTPDRSSTCLIPISMAKTFSSMISPTVWGRAMCRQ
jgi:hypothetical protein